MLNTFANNNKFQSVLLWIQSSSFAVLYSFLYYPQTNFLSDLCLVLGALCSCYVIYREVNWQILFSKCAIPIWLVLALFLWVLTHLIFFSQDYVLQLRELESIWKRVLIASIFAFGFGINLSVHHKQILNVMWLIYIGLMGPVFIYLFKFSLALLGNSFSIEIPEYLRLFGTYQESMYSIYKAIYIAFWLPALAVSLAQIFLILGWKSHSGKSIGVFTVCAFLIVFSFYLLGSKSGVACSAILFIIFIISILYKLIFRETNFHTRLVSVAVLLISILFIGSVVNKHVSKHRTWEMLIYDAKIGVQIEKYDHWKYFGNKGYPDNELNTPVKNTNYERVAWAIVGVNLIKENPLGYGLVERSFAWLTKKKWTDSILDQAHSAWIDLILGIGIVGFALIFSALIFTTLNLCQLLRKSSITNYLSMPIAFKSLPIALIAALLATVIGWAIAEICQKNQLILLLFWIMLGAGFSLNSKNGGAIRRD